jgi:DNA-binding XRE family transcriptional regulator
MRLRRRPGMGPAPGSADIPAEPRQAAAIGALIARERNSRGVTQQQVADALGVSVDEVAALETGTGPAGRREISEALVRYRRAVREAQRKPGPAQASP